MDRPVVLLKHLDDDTVLLAVEHPDGAIGPVKMDRTKLVDELAFPRGWEIGSWIRLPAIGRE